MWMMKAIFTTNLQESAFIRSKINEQHIIYMLLIDLDKSMFMNEYLN